MTLDINLLSDEEIRTLFGDFKYKDKNDGRIIVEKKWVCKNIVSFEALKISLLEKLQLRKFGNIRCHRLVKNQLVKMFSEIEEKGLSQFIDVRDTLKKGGCFFPRHISWDIKKPLSRHSWGIAIDVNPSTNLVGTKGNMDSRIVEIFEKNGFIWGGRWSIPDPMHFEFVRVTKLAGNNV